VKEDLIKQVSQAITKRLAKRFSKKAVVKAKFTRAPKNQLRQVKRGAKKLDAAQLDKELDQYWVKNGDAGKLKSNLDCELEEYMKKAK
jgi:hypothetical protein